MNRPTPGNHAPTPRPLVWGFPHLVVLVVLSGCASWPGRWGTRPCCIETKPVVIRQPIGWHLFDVTVLAPLTRSLHVVRMGRRLFGVPVRALNLRHGQIPDSAFFTNRDPVRLTPEEVRWGPTLPGDLAQPPFTITKPKMEGKTPGFFVTDARGNRYLFKLDPPDAPELLSGAEVVTSKLLSALGYHVPSYEIVSVRGDELQLAPELRTPSGVGTAPPFTPSQVANSSRWTRDGTISRHPSGSGMSNSASQLGTGFTAADLQELVESRMRQGVLRVVASKIVEGEVLGPATFKHFRDCAEVRALKVVYAWVNNTDAKDHNSLLVWDGTKTIGYLIDFGTSLGADAGRAGAKAPCAGWSNVVDLSELSQEVITFGLHRSGCHVHEQPFSPAVGLFSSHVDPDRWKPYAPNLAFNEINADDAQWIAERMARVSLAHIGAAVSAARYTDPADVVYLVEVLDQRRRVIVDHYLDEDDAKQEGPRR